MQMKVLYFCVWYPCLKEWQESVLAHPLAHPLTAKPPFVILYNKKACQSVLELNTNSPLPI